MKKVITYGTFDLLHVGHINILKRAKALGDYLIVGVTDDSYDISRGKINVCQSVVDRIKAVEKTGLADEIIIEKRDGQKINDIIKYDIDVIVLGSDWTGKIDYLKKYCEVVYLPRTNNISSTKLRCGERVLTVALLSDSKHIINDFEECRHIGEIEVSYIYTTNKKSKEFFLCKSITIAENIQEIINSDVDICIVNLEDESLYNVITSLLKSNKSVYVYPNEFLIDKKIDNLYTLAKDNNVYLILTPYVHFNPLVYQMKSLIHSNYIGEIQSLTIEQTVSEKNIKTAFISYLSLLLDFTKIQYDDVFNNILLKNCNNSIKAIIIKNNKYYILNINSNKFISNNFCCQGSLGVVQSKCKLNKLNYFKITTNTQKKYISDQEIVFSRRFVFIELIKLIKKSNNNHSIRYNIQDIENLNVALKVLKKAIEE